jgi:N-acetylglutamate synthase-like GNAT family acetyltransferase
VREILDASYPVLMRPSYDEDVLVAAFPTMTRANKTLLRRGTYHLAESKDQLIVGCGGWSLKRPRTGELEPGLDHVRHFATHPDWLGRGIGRAIYEMSEQEARAASVEQFEVYSSLNAEGFYAAMGFSPVRTFEMPLYQDLTIPAVLMARRL